MVYTRYRMIVLHLPEERCWHRWRSSSAWFFSRCLPPQERPRVSRTASSPPPEGPTPFFFFLRNWAQTTEKTKQDQARQGNHFSSNEVVFEKPNTDSEYNNPPQEAQTTAVTPFFFLDMNTQQTQTNQRYAAVAPIEGMIEKKKKKKITVPPPPCLVSGGGRSSCPFFFHSFFLSLMMMFSDCSRENRERKILNFQPTDTLTLVLVR